MSYISSPHHIFISGMGNSTNHHISHALPVISTNPVSSSQRKPVLVIPGRKAAKKFSYSGRCRHKHKPVSSRSALRSPNPSVHQAVFRLFPKGCSGSALWRVRLIGTFLLGAPRVGRDRGTRRLALGRSLVLGIGSGCWSVSSTLEIVTPRLLLSRLVDRVMPRSYGDMSSLHHVTWSQRTVVMFAGTTADWVFLGFTIAWFVFCSS